MAAPFRTRRCCGATSTACPAAGVDLERPGGGCRPLFCPEPDFALASCDGIFLYQKVNGAWTEVAVLRQSHPGAIDAFGASVSVSVSGDVVAVGSWAKDCSNKFQCGAVYIYKKPAGAGKT